MKAKKRLDDLTEIIMKRIKELDKKDVENTN